MFPESIVEKPRKVMTRFQKYLDLKWRTTKALFLQSFISMRH